MDRQLLADVAIHPLRTTALRADDSWILEGSRRFTRSLDFRPGAEGPKVRVRTIGDFWMKTARTLRTLATVPDRTVTRVISKPQAVPRYVVQLCQSTVPMDPHAIPQLDLFRVYHLYCDVKLRNGVSQYSLRLGLFKEPGTAKAIARYLARYFNAIRVMQIDATEIVCSLRDKFLAQRDVDASGQHAVNELSAPSPLPVETHAVVAKWCASSTNTARSMWARLLRPFHRLSVATQQG